MKSKRIIICVATAILGVFAGFAVWYWLFGAFFAGMALVGFLLAATTFAIARLKKKESEVAGSWLACAVVFSALLGGWCARSIFREEAMIAESLRLVIRADDFRKKEGRFAHSARTLAPIDVEERLIAWLAGDSVRYGGYADRYCIARGGPIVGEVFWSTDRKWRVEKI